MDKSQIITLVMNAIITVVTTAIVTRLTLNRGTLGSAKLTATLKARLARYRMLILAFSSDHCVFWFSVLLALKAGTSGSLGSCYDRSKRGYVNDVDHNCGD